MQHEPKLPPPGSIAPHQLPPATSKPTMKNCPTCGKLVNHPVNNAICSCDHNSARSNLLIFLCNIGCKRCKYFEHRYYLDRIDYSFYLVFDADIDEENPQPHTVNIIAVPTGELPNEAYNYPTLLENATLHEIVQFMSALRLSKYSEQTRLVLIDTLARCSSEYWSTRYLCKCGSVNSVGTSCPNGCN